MDIMDTDGNEERQCVWCDRVWAMVGVLMGAVLIVMSIDLITDGALANMLPKREVMTGDE